MMKDMRLLLFAGTYHGRKLCEQLLEAGAVVYVSSYSQMGDERLPDHPNCHRLIGPVDSTILEGWNAQWSLDAIIDATHPYAIGIRTMLVDWAKEQEKKEPSQRIHIPMLRYERPESIRGSEGSFFDSMEELCSYVRKKDGNILFTTGIRQIPEIMKYLPQERLIFRILDAEGSIQEALKAGLDFEQLVIANPPFSQEDTGRLMGIHDIKYVVTKDGGVVGGTREKVAACQGYGAELLILRRPYIAEMSLYIEQATTSEEVMAWIKQ